MMNEDDTEKQRRWEVQFICCNRPGKSLPRIPGFAFLEFSSKVRENNGKFDRTLCMQEESI